MTAGTWNPVIEKGATWSRTLTYRDELGALVNLSGYTARMQCRAARDDTVLFELTGGNGITLGGAAGTIILTLSATATAALFGLGGSYDLELVSGATVTRLVEGTITFSPEITR